MAAPAPDAEGRIGARIENYTKFWSKDLAQEKEVHTDNRVEGYTDVVNGVHIDFPERPIHSNKQ